MGFCSYCSRDINKKSLIKCEECNKLYCKKCYVKINKMSLCLNCYIQHIENYQEELITNVMNEVQTFY